MSSDVHRAVRQQGTTGSGCVSSKASPTIRTDAAAGMFSGNGTSAMVLAVAVATDDWASASLRASCSVV